MTNENLRKYELMLMLSSTLTDSEIEQELGEIKKQIKGMKGKVFSEDAWGIRDLAFNIKKEDKAYYVVLYIELEDPSVLVEFEKALKINQAVLRYLLLKFDKNHVIKTLEEIEVEIEAENAEKEKEKAEIEKKNNSRKAPVKSERKPLKVEKTFSAPKVDVKKEASEKKLEEVDQKLNTLIDDPNITL